MCFRIYPVHGNAYHYAHVQLCVVVVVAGGDGAGGAGDAGGLFITFIFKLLFNYHTLKTWIVISNDFKMQIRFRILKRIFL